MSHLRADNRSYCSFLAHSMPSGTYRKLADTCRVTELNHKCIIIKFSPTALFASDCTYEYMNIVQLKSFLQLLIQTAVSVEMGITEGWGSVTWILQGRKIPSPQWSQCSGEQTTCISCRRHTRLPVVGSKSLPCARHFASTVTVNAIETEVQLACRKPCSLKRQKMNSSQISSISVFMLFPLQHSNCQRTLNM